MLFGLLASIILSSAASVNVTGLEVSEDHQVWIGVVSDAGTPRAALEVYSRENSDSSFGHPLIRVGQDDIPVAGGALKADGKGRMLLFYSLLDGTPGGTIYMQSCKTGSPREWESPVKVGRGSIHSAPLILNDGTLVLAVSRQGEGALACFSSDDGLTWEEGALVNVPERRLGANNNPAIFTAPGGTLRMACRSCDTGFAYVCDSSDGGRTWSTPVRFVQNPDRDFCVINTGPETVFLLKNIKLDILQFYSNRELYGYFSRDGGSSWYGEIQVSQDDYISDPVAVQSPDGSLLIAWSRQHKGESCVKITRCRDGICSAPETVFEAGLSQETYRQSIAFLTTPRTRWGKKGVRLGTYNIQRQGFGSGPSWESRRPAVIEEFREHKWDIVGTQEATPAYAEEIIEATGGEYAYFADTPEFMGDKARSGSENPVLYRKSRFTLLDCGVIEYAINQTLFVGARTNRESYGSEYHRSTIWGHFYDKANDMEFYCVNLHGPVRSAPAQEAYARIMLDSLAVITRGLPMVITGDFNYAEDSWAYRYLTDREWVQDSMTALPEPKRKNWEYNSNTGYRAKEEFPKKASHLDHILYTPASIQINSWWLDINTTWENKYSSDHLPITVEFKYSN